MAAATAMFTKVDVHSNEGDTSKMFNLNSSTLYEIRTVLDIKAEGAILDDASLPELAVDANKDKLAIGVGPVLHVMRISPDIRCEQSLTFVTDVCAVRFLIDGRLLIVALADGSIIFVNTYKLDGQHRTRKLLPSCSSGSKIVEYSKEHDLLLIVTDVNGNSSIVELPKFDRIAECDLRVLDEHLTDVINGAKYISDVKLSSSLTSLMSASELVSFSSSPGTSASLSLDSDSFLESSEFMESEYGFECVRKVGYFVVCLTKHGMLQFYDEFTGQMIREIDLRCDKNFNDKILSFEFLDAKGNEENLDSLKLLLTVKSENGKDEVQIRRFSDNHVEYQVRTSENVVMLPESAGEDNYIILIDPFNYKNRNSIQLRFINEAYPEIRFDKLLACGRYDDAEAFAKLYKLDIQKVHIKRAYELINEFGDDDQSNVELADKILSYCDKVSDDNIVGDICNDAINVFPTYKCISSFLNYASKRKITDHDIASQLASRRYDLLTFAAISDCEKSFNADAWFAMVEEEDAVFRIFETSWAVGEVTAARIFWSRYTKRIQDYLIYNGKVEEMIDNLQAFVLDQPTYLTDVIEFVQHDFGPFYLTINDDLVELQSRCNTLVDFVSSIAVGLERVEPENFPKNSLFACEMISRMLDILRLEKTTPAHQKLLYNIFGILGSSTVNAQTAVGQLAIRTDNLRKMLRLKDSYQCKIAYNQYVAHTVESICFLILDRCKTVQAVPKHIQKVALPYMKEQGLKKDATLLEYIKKVSERGANSETNQQNNPWDDLCICFAEAIDNILYRCQAIIKIAKRSSIPWSNRLRTAVNEMFKAKGISADLRRELNIQYQTEELSNLMIEYDISLKYLSRSFNRTSVMELLARAFYTSTKPLTEKMEQLTRMAQLFEVISQKDMEVEYTVAQAVALAANFYVNNDDIAPIKEAFAVIKSKYCREAAAETLVNMCISMLEFCDASLAETRCAAMDSCCIIARTYLPLTSSIEQTLDIVNRLHQLQKNFKLFIPYSELTNRGKDASVQRLIQYLAEPPTKTFEETVYLGQLLSIKKEIICDLIVENSPMASQDIYEAALFLIGETVDELDKAALDTSLHYIRKMFYIFHQYSSERGNTFRSEHATYIINFFRRLAPCLIKLTDTALRLELPFEADLLFFVQEFIGLFEQTLKCLTEMPGDADRSFSASFSAEIVHKETSKIYEMSHRWGVLNPVNAGTIFDGVEVIKALGRVGYSLFMKSNGDDTLLDVTTTEASMYDLWEDVFLCFNGNPYLIIIAQNFAFKLPCLSKVIPDRKIVQSQIVELCQKILVAEKIDLQLAVSLVFYLPDEAVIKIITDLFSWATAKQNSRVIFYVSRIAQLVSFITKDKHARNTIFESYRGAWWSRRLAQEGITSLNINSASAVHADFISNIGCPLLYKEYCEAFNLDSNERLLSYAFDLLRTSATEKDVARFDKILDTAGAIFQMAECDPEALCKQSFHVIEYLCPYNYKALSLLLSYMCQWSSLCSIAELKDRADEYRLLLLFLDLFERKNDFTLQETRWYLERQKHRQEHSSGASDSMDFEMETDHDLLNVDDRQNMLEKNYPSVARKHLPFHVFILKNQDDYEKLIDPILSNEIDIQNVSGWLHILEKTTYVCLRISRTALVTTAISNKVREVVSQQSELNEEDIKTISSLLVSIKIRINMLKKLATELNKLPLCMAKVRVLALVRDVGIKWLDTSKDVSKEREAIFDFIQILNKILKKYECEFILDHYSVVVVEKNLYEDGAALVQHIFAEHIDWNNRDDIQRKMALAREITRIHDITLDDSLKEIVENWLKGGESVAGYLKPVITGQLNNQMITMDSCDNLFPPLPYNDVDVVRMAYILTELQSKETCRRVANHLIASNNESVSNLLQRLRILCVFIRCLNDQGFQKCFSCTINDFADQLFSMILGFAFKVCQVDCKLVDYVKNPALQFVQSLVNAQSGVKQSLETFQLAAVAIIDRGIDDIGLIEKTLKRLMKYKCSPYIAMLLNYSVRLQRAQFSAYLPNYFSNVNDAFWDSVDKDDAIPEHRYRDLVYFILSCPVEAGSNYKRLLQIFEKNGLVVACRMIASIAGLPDASKRGGIVARSSMDVPRLNPDSMNSLGTMMKTLRNADDQTQASSHYDGESYVMEE